MARRGAKTTKGHPSSFRNFLPLRRPHWISRQFSVAFDWVLQGSQYALRSRWEYPLLRFQYSETLSADDFPNRLLFLIPCQVCYAIAREHNIENFEMISDGARYFCISARR